MHAAFVFGDPHMITLDGLKYTFNGKGEYTLIETEDDSFTVQARMVPVETAAGTLSLATVFSAVVIMQVNSDTVQFEISDTIGTLVVVNEEEIDFSELEEQEFANVTVTVSTKEENTSYSASFSSGAYFVVTEENNIFSALSISLPERFKDIRSQGLMGSFNGNISDDLLPKLGQKPLPINSTLQEIHEKFGITCKSMHLLSRCTYNHNRFCLFHFDCRDY